MALSWPLAGWAQTTSSGSDQQSSCASQPSNPCAVPPGDTKTDRQTVELPPNPEPQGQQTKRILGVVPNFGAVSAGVQLPPLTPRGKFILASKDSFDYSSFVWTGMLAAQALALNSDPELGSGIAGYGRYYWRTFVDGVSGTFFTEAIIPVLSHEDPRYYTRGNGRSGWYRLGYALSRTVVTQTDSGGESFNWSEVAGNLCEAALSNAYYPPQERGTSQTFRNWGTQMESAALNNIAKEFWPDVRRKVLRRK